MDQQQYQQQPAPQPAPVKKSKAPFIILGAVVFLVGLLVLALATKGFGQLDNILSLSGNAPERVVGSWIVVAVEEDGATIELADYEQTLAGGQAPFRDMRILFFEDSTGFAQTKTSSIDFSWKSLGHGLYALYDDNDELSHAEVHQDLLYLGLDTADFNGTLVFERHELTLIHD